MVKPVGSGSPVRAMVIAAAATVVAALPVFLTAPMTVQLTQDLDFGTVGIGAAVGAFFATMAISSMYLGRVADRLGATVSLRIGAAGSATAALGIAVLARSWLTLAVWLVVAGMASAISQPGANRLLINRVRRDRLGAAFGLKQSAPPMAAMLGGFSVPVIALTVGWRWAFALAAVLSLLVAVLVGPRPADASKRVVRSERVRPEPLRDRTTLVVLAVGFGLAWATSSVVLAFYVDAAVHAGSTPQFAGTLFAVASLGAVTTRLLAGRACDRYVFAPLRLCAALLALGSLGHALLASGRPVVMAYGVIVGLCGTWGFPGVFWFALVRAYPDTPGRITGAMAPGALGGVLGPVGFGALASTASYRLAWSLAGCIALLAATAMVYGARRLRTDEFP